MRAASASTDGDQRRLLKTTKFDPVLDKKVDMRKVELAIMRPWIANKVTELLGLCVRSTRERG